VKFNDDDRVDLSQVEDRRGAGRMIGVGLGGMGVLGAIVVALVRLLGGDDIAGAEVRPVERERVRNGPNAIAPGSCKGVTSANDHAKFIACVETSVQKYWADAFARSGETYRPSKLVLFTERTPTGCGAGSAATGPFYCSRDEKVYLDLGFFQALRTRLGAQGGDFAEAYVVAHEYGHHVQDLLGIMRKVHARMQRNEERQNDLSVRLELQADCYAGVWGHAAYSGGKVDPAEVGQALDAAAAVGDDRIQERVTGRVHPESFTHGSSAMRKKWFDRGMRSGDPAACNTFADEP
jgi:uncharacterized protein